MTNSPFKMSTKTSMETKKTYDKENIISSIPFSKTIIPANGSSNGAGTGFLYHRVLC